MRLYLFPISTKRTLIYAKRLNQQLTDKQTYIERITGKAATTWHKWEGAESGWQKKVTEWGNKAFSRIPYQEWGLKSIPPLSARRTEDELKGKDKVEVLYPDSIIKENGVLPSLQKLATERQELHRKSMWWSIVAMPLTAPFAVVPMFVLSAIELHHCRH